MTWHFFCLIVRSEFWIFRLGHFVPIKLFFFYFYIISFSSIMIFVTVNYIVKGGPKVGL